MRNGIVQSIDITIATVSEPLLLESGRTLTPVTVRYETYGSLNEERSNAILVLHAFSGDAHAAGYHHADDRAPGWWDTMIGPGRALDTNRFFVISSNVLGSCQGTTGPGSENPETSRPWAMSFPAITIGDMVDVQHRLIAALGIETLFAVVGGSMGGMQALEWVARYPAKVERAVLLATTTQLSAQAIAFNAVGRNAIMSDPRWNKGDYYHAEPPSQGLSVARMVGHITYLSSESMRMKFGRRIQDNNGTARDAEDQFAVESYLSYQGEKFVDRFDANSYIYLSRAMDAFDLAGSYGGLEAAFSSAETSFLIISYSSDWLFPTDQSKEIVFALARTGKEVSYTEIQSPYGHDAFLIEYELQSELSRKQECPTRPDR